MQTVSSKDGTMIALWKSGSGPPLVLIHGSTADHTRWNPILPDLEQRFTVYAVDRRGRGKSTDSSEYAVEREFEDVVAVVDSIDKPVNLLGHSFGALCCLEAPLLTEKINRLILYEPQAPGVKLMSIDAANKIQQLLNAGDRDGALGVYMLEVGKIPPNELYCVHCLPGQDV